MDLLKCSNLYGGELNFQTITFMVRRGYVASAGSSPARHPSLDSAPPFGSAFSGPALLENLWISVKKKWTKEKNLWIRD